MFCNKRHIVKLYNMTANGSVSSGQMDIHTCHQMSELVSESKKYLTVLTKTATSKEQRLNPAKKYLFSFDAYGPTNGIPTTFSNT